MQMSINPPFSFNGCGDFKKEQIYSLLDCDASHRHVPNIRNCHQHRIVDLRQFVDYAARDERFEPFE